MSSTPEPTVSATQYRVSLLPESVPQSELWDIEVVARGNGLWAVTHFSRCLAVDGEWDYEPSPSNREDDWLAEHRFKLDVAIGMAKVVATTITVNGKTAVEVLRGMDDLQNIVEAK